MNNPNPQEETVFHAARQLTEPAERRAYLDAACADQPALRRRVEALLAAQSDADKFFDAGPVAGVGLGSSGPTPEPLKEQPGDRIGCYRLLEKIGEGGCGVVYLAEQEEPIRRRVALKVIKLGMDTQAVVARFEAERQVLAMMDHPNIAKVFEAGATDSAESQISNLKSQIPGSRPYFVMELVKGVPITGYCDQYQLSTRERLALFVQVCHAVQHAHQKGIIHRDLKPSNILVTSADGAPVPKVIDFGIAKATHQQLLTDQTVFTALHQFIGTPAYMSPEQAELGAADIDTRSDIYSLGVLLYELLTGKPPFEPETLLKAGFDEMRRIIRETEPVKPSTRLTERVAADVSRRQSSAPQPSTLNSQPRQEVSADSRRRLHEVKGDLDWIVMKCLEKDRRRRYDTANALADDLKRHLNHEPVTAAAPSPIYMLRKFARRHKTGLAASTAIVLLLVTGAAVSTWQAVRATRAERAETVQRREAEARSAESRARLVRLNVANGVRAMDDGDAFGGLLWFTEALRLETTNRAAESRHRLRLGCTLGQLPKLAQMWFHDDWVVRAGFSPDGRRVVTIGGGQVQIREANSGRLVTTLPLRHKFTFAPAFTADSRRVLSGDDQTMRLWDMTTGQPASPLLPHPARVLAAALSPDGQRVFSVCAQGPDPTGGPGTPERVIRFWNTGAGRETRPPLKWYEPIQELAVSPDGRWLAAIGSEGGATLWDLRTPRALRLLEDNTDLATIVPGTLPAAGQEVEPVERLLPEVSQALSRERRAADYAWARSVAFSPNSRQVVFACDDDAAHVWSLDTGKRLQVLRQPSSRARKRSHWMRVAHFSPDGQRVLTTGGDGVARIWNVESGQALGEARPPGGRLNDAVFSPDGRWLATLAWAAGDYGEARVWHAATGKQAFPALLHAEAVSQVVFSPDGCSLLTAGADRTVRFWSLATGEATWPTLQHDVESAPHQVPAARQQERPPKKQIAVRSQSELTGARFSEDGRRIATVNANGSARVWDARHGQPITPLVRLDDKPLLFAAFSPDGSRFVAGGGWCFSSNGYSLSSPLGAEPPLFEAGVAGVWDASTGTPITGAIPHSQVVLAGQFSPDGRWLLTRSARNVWVWDALTGQPAKLPVLSEAPLRAAAWSGDGRLLAVNRDLSPSANEARVWNVLTGQPITPPLNEPGTVTDLQFSPDGRWLVTVATDPQADWWSRYCGYAASVRIWNATTGQPVSPPLRPTGHAFVQLRNAQEIFPKLLFSPDNSRLMVLSLDRIAVAWDLVRAQPIEPLPLPNSRAVPVAVHLGDGWVATLGDGENLRVWDTANGEALTSELRIGAEVRAVSHSLDGRVLAVLTKAQATLWPLVADMRPLAELADHVQLLAGRRVDERGAMVVMPAAERRALWEKLRVHQPSQFTVTPAQVRAWRERAAQTSEHDEAWFAAVFHLEPLCKEQPDDEPLSFRLARARNNLALANLK